MAHCLAALNPEDVEWLVTHGTVQWLEPESVIIAEGIYLDALVLMLQGVACVDATYQGRESVASTLIDTTHSPTLLGELSYMDGRATVASVVAQTRCQVVRVPFLYIERKVERDRGFACRLYETLAVLLAQRLREVSRWVVGRPLIGSAMMRQVLLFFAVLQDQDIDFLIRKGQVQVMSTGDSVLLQGESVAYFSLILSGQLTIEVANEMEASVVDMIGAGEILGELALLEDLPASASVVARQRSYLLSLEKAELCGILREQRGFARRFYEALAVVLADRIRNTLYQRGVSVVSFQQGEATRFGDDEINFETLDRSAIAAARFDWLRRRVSQVHAVRADEFSRA